MDVAMNRRRRHQRGLSLVEVMIALTLGAIVTAGIVQLFVANSETYNLMQGQSRMQESARFALTVISRTAQDSGYRGCFSSNEDLHTTIDPASNIPYEFDLRFGVRGYNSTGGSWLPSIADLPSTVDGTDTNVFQTPAGDGAGNGINTDEIAPGADILTLRNMSPIEARLVADLPTSTEPVVVSTPANGLEYEEDYLAMIHDCEKATIFRITSLDEDNPTAGQTTIGHSIADVDATRNSIEKLALVNTFEDDAGVSAIETYTYYIAPGAGRNNVGDRPLSLWRKSGIEEPVELVEGVEDLQILYGVDTDADEIPNQYMQANAVGNWNSVETIRATVVANSIDDVGADTADGLIRRSFTQTIKLRN